MRSAPPLLFARERAACRVRARWGWTPAATAPGSRRLMSWGCWCQAAWRPRKCVTVARSPFATAAHNSGVAVAAEFWLRLCQVLSTTSTRRRLLSCWICAMARASVIQLRRHGGVRGRALLREKRSARQRASVPSFALMTQCTHYAARQRTRAPCRVPPPRTQHARGGGHDGEFCGR